MTEAPPMLTRIRQLLHESQLRKFKTTNLDKVKSGHFNSIDHIGVLFYAGAEKEVDPVLQFRDKTKARGIDVDLVGYYDTKEEPGPQSFSYFNDASLNFAMIPGSDVVRQFIEQPLDVLINLDYRLHRPVTYIAAASRALFKVGPANGDHAHYDLMIDLGDNYNTRELIAEFRKTFRMING